MPNKTPIFINCPFDDEFKPLFQAIVFTVLKCACVPRCALEVVDSGGTRIAKIEAIIEDCPLGIHDISRTELDATNNLPRFNMPLELGLFLGAKRFGDARQKRKRCLVLDPSKLKSENSCRMRHVVRPYFTTPVEPRPAWRYPVPMAP